MGKTEKREFVSRLTVLLLHLLKWKFQPEGQGNSWRLSIVNARDEIVDLLDDNPSLKWQIDGIIRSAYRYARRKAAIETDSGRTYFRRNVRGRSNARWMGISGHERHRRADRDTFRQGCAHRPNLLIRALRTWENARSPAGIDVRTTKLQLARPSLRERAASLLWEQPHGKENCRLYQATSAGGRRQSVAPDRSRARPARSQHHGILQGVQCAHRADGEGLADSGRHHRLSGPLLHL